MEPLSSSAETLKSLRVKKKKETKTAGANWRHTWLAFPVPLLLLAIWETLSRVGIFPDHILPAPSVVFFTIVSLGSSGELWEHLGITLIRVFLGFLFGSLFAVILGAFVGFSRKAELLFDPLLQAFRSIPSLAWVPLFILWMGIGEPSKVALIAVGVFFPVYLNIASGIHGVDRKLVEVGQIYQLSRLALIRRIILPAAMPSFLVGLRGGLGLGWMFVVAAELMGASEGLGYLLTLGRNTYAPEIIIASIVLFAVLGKMTDALLKKLERRTLHWQDRFERRA